MLAAILISTFLAVAPVEPDAQFRVLDETYFCPDSDATGYRHDYDLNGDGWLEVIVYGWTQGDRHGSPVLFLYFPPPGPDDAPNAAVFIAGGRAELMTFAELVQRYARPCTLPVTLNAQEVS